LLAIPDIICSVGDWEEDAAKCLADIAPNKIIASDKQREDPKEFILELNDLCSDQNSDTVRSHAMKLLCALAEHQTGFLTFAGAMCIDMVSKSVHQADDQFFQDLEARFSLRMHPAEFAEIGLICLAAMGYLIFKRKDLRAKNID
jgi:hypothetical protein